jgi:hypothetical protein
LLTAEVGAQGGTLVVDVPGEALDGLTVVIPPGAFSSATRLAIATRPVESHSFSADFNPASGLISIDAGGELAGELITLLIPVDVPADQFAMAFAYQARGGTLQGLPVVDSGTDGIKVVTRDLSRDFVVSTTGLDRFEGDISTGFVHGVDDWQFTNYGSVVSPGGHCAGQSLTAMYYFIEDLGPPLFGRYDNYDNPYPDTPDLMWDDELGYRLASVAQETADWDGPGLEYWAYFSQDEGGDAVFNAFAYSMLLTGAPQFAGIYHTDEEGEVSGHALIVYGKHGEQLLVSDPNYPFGSEGGEGERFIEYDPDFGIFKPYYSGPNADELGVAYTDIYFFGYKDLIDWSRLGDLWAELEAGSIGQEEFPAYELAVRDGDSEFEDELWFNYEAASDEITVRVRDADFNPLLAVYDAAGKLLGASNKPVKLPLAEGDNFYGFRVEAEAGGQDHHWVGFDWIKIVYQPDESAGAGKEPASLCELLPPGGTVGNETETQCSQTYPQSGGTAYIVLTHRADASAATYCDSLKEGNYGAYMLYDLYPGHDCGYIALDVDYGTQNLRLDGGWWVAFVKENYSVKVHSGSNPGDYLDYPENADWVIEMAEQVAEAISAQIEQGR